MSSERCGSGRNTVFFLLLIGMGVYVLYFDEIVEDLSPMMELLPRANDANSQKTGLVISQNSWQMQPHRENEVEAKRSHNNTGLFNWTELYSDRDMEQFKRHEYQPIIEFLPINNLPKPQHVTETPVVLLWNKFFSEDPFIIFQNFNTSTCPPPRCEYTSDRDRFGEADAVLFHSRDIELNDTPISHQLTRPPGQIWIWNNLESPIFSGFTDQMRRSALFSSFNWTMTYRTDSDVYHPYSRIIKKSSESSLNWDQVRLDVRKKTHLAVWPVSHCHTPSKREKLVEQLQSHGLSIDIIGACATTDNYDCSVDKSTPVPNYTGCFSKFEKKYKFVLALENSLCQDYVTEKFFNAFNFLIVPISYNGGSLGFRAPAGSYIDVTDFNGTRALAEYLLDLDKNEEEYLSYFKYKENYTVQEVGAPSWCRLCEKLHRQRKDNHGKVQYYPNVVEWYENVFDKATKKRRKDMKVCVDSDKIEFKS